MKKYRSYLFLVGLVLIFFIVGYIFFGSNNQNGVTDEKIKAVVERADSLINVTNPPEFTKAFNLLDSCNKKDNAYYKNEEFKKKYDRLKIITDIKN